MVFTPVAGWDQIAQNNIFPGESGGDYDALFGFQNRPGGRFAGTRISQMPLRDVIAFSQPGGDYGQTVKGQIGRVATPMGAYQVVGTTLREAVAALGLDPNQPFDKATQDLIGQWIYTNQGPEAWEAWGKSGGGAGPATVSTMGGPRAGGTGTPLGYMNGDRDFPLFDPGMTGRDRFATGLAASGEALTSLGAGRGPTFEATDRWMGMEALRRAQQQAGAAMQRGAPSGADPNQTVAWLQANGHTDLVEAVSAGIVSPKDAMTEALQRDPVVPVDPNAPLTDEALGNINTLRDDYRTDLAPFMETQNAAQNIFAAAGESGGAGDFVVAQQFAKLLDPTSVVREGELSAVQSVGGSLNFWLEKAQGEIEMTGGSMAPATKAEILKLTEQIVKVRRQSAEAKLGTYRKLAERAGIDPTLLGLEDLAMLPPAPAIPPAGSVVKTVLEGAAGTPPVKDNGFGDGF